MVGVAVKVTEVPAQMAPSGTAAMLTLAVRIGLTVMLIEEEVAGEPARQGVALEVICTVMASPWARAAEV